MSCASAECLASNKGHGFLRAAQVWVRGQGWRLAVWLGLVAAVVMAAGVSCGGGGSEGVPTVAVTTAPVSPTPPIAVSNDPGATVIAVVQACREKNVAQLRALVVAPTSDEEISAMYARGNDVQLLSQSVPDGGTDSVSIDVSLRVMSDEGETVVQRAWELERGADRVWRLSALPECY